jgi:hypothetical protein
MQIGAHWFLARANDFDFGFVRGLKPQHSYKQTKNNHSATLSGNLKRLS